MRRPKPFCRVLSIFNPPLCGRQRVWEKWFFSSFYWPRTWIERDDELLDRAHRSLAERIEAGCMGKAAAVTLCQRKIATFQYQVRNNFGRAADGHIWHHAVRSNISTQKGDIPLLAGFAERKTYSNGQKWAGEGERLMEFLARCWLLLNMYGPCKHLQFQAVTEVESRFS
jgi:hypothetical protein